MVEAVRFVDLDEDEKLAVARETPAALSKYLNPDRQILRHTNLMSDLVKSAVEDGIRTGHGPVVIVTVPPGHAKSDTVSVHGVCWFLLNWPDRNIALASYEHQKAAEWGRADREIIREVGPKMDVHLEPGASAAHRWKTTQGGGLLCTGIGGPLTGYRAHALFIDDPVKNAEDAASEVKRETAWNWYRSVALTRLWPEAPIFIILTRWHEDDLAGRVMAHDKEVREQGLAATDLRVFRMPCVAEEDDPLGREIGEPLAPEMGYTKEWAARKEVAVGSKVWASLYQCRPSIEGGGMFRDSDFRYWSEASDGSWVLHHGDGQEERIQPTSCWRAQVVDTAMKEKTTSDWTVVGTFAITRRKRQVLVLNIERQRIEIPDQLPLIRQQRQKWKPRWTGVEDKASGTGIIQEARRQGLILRPLKPENDKVTRASPASALCEQNAIFFKRDAHWLETFEHELKGFPNSTFDDQVDVLAYLVRELATQPGYSGSKPRVQRSGLDGLNDGNLAW